MRREKLSRSLVLLVAVGLPAVLAGASLPKLKVTNLDGQRQEVRDYQGKAKIIVLNFWATWCGPCNDEMPMLVKEQTKYKEHGVQVIGVSLDKPGDEGKVKKFIAQYGVNFPIWVGGTADDLERWKMGPAVPATAFVEDGKIVGRVCGEMRQPSFEHRIEWMLGKHEGQPPKAVENNLNVKE